MFRNALRQSTRSVGAISASSRIASVRGLLFLLPVLDLDRRIFRLSITSARSRNLSIAAVVKLQGRVEETQTDDGRSRLLFRGQNADLCVCPSQTTRTAAPASINAASKSVRAYASDAKASPTEVSSILEQRIRGVQEEAGLAETGRVLSVGYVVNPVSYQRGQVGPQ